MISVTSDRAVDEKTCNDFNEYYSDWILVCWWKSRGRKMFSINYCFFEVSSNVTISISIFC